MFYKIITEIKGEHAWDTKKLDVPEVNHNIPESYIVNVEDLRISKIEIGSWMSHTYKIISKEVFDNISNKILWPSELGMYCSERYQGSIIIRTKGYGDILTYINIRTNKDDKEYYCLTSAFKLYDNDYYSITKLPKRNIKIFTTKIDFTNDKKKKEFKTKKKWNDELKKQKDIRSQIPSFEFKTPKFKIVNIIKETEKTSAKVGDIIQGILPVIDKNQQKCLKGIGTTTNWIQVYINDKFDKSISPLTFQELFFNHYVVEQIKD